jgi:hypothetical protein
MLTETRATAIRYDCSADAVAVHAGTAKEPERSATLDATLLLDGSGFLVGIDLGGPGLNRTVVMLGQHEDVASTKGAKVTVTRGADGEIARVTIARARSAVRGAERNPYVR